MKLTRFPGNPILEPHPGHPWEDLAVFNPGAWIADGRVWLLYRAAESGPEYKCYFGLAVSDDGCSFRKVSQHPVFSPSADGFDASTVQDPRVVKMGDYYYITYACRTYPYGQFWLPAEERPEVLPQVAEEFPRALRHNKTSTGLLITRDFKTYIRAGRMTDPLLDDRDVVLFPEKVNGRFVMMHRPLEWTGPAFGTGHPAAWISTADDLFGFRKSRLLIRARGGWEDGKVGVNTPPVRTEHGWLTLYHAVGPDRYYRLGALLLDLEEPHRVLHRTPDWILQPEQEYEIEGYYRGCVFPCGKVVRDDTLYVYYGAADKTIALATCPLSEFIDFLRRCPFE